MSRGRRFRRRAAGLIVGGAMRVADVVRGKTDDEHLLLIWNLPGTE